VDSTQQDHPFQASGSAGARERSYTGSQNMDYCQGVSERLGSSRMWIGVGVGIGIGIGLCHCEEQGDEAISLWVASLRSQ
jgi:uncharacterized RmlC-like cupin family protein